MKEWYVYWTTRKCEQDWIIESHFIVLTSFWKVVWWFLRTAHRCEYISIRLEFPAACEGDRKDPCETCLRWDECGGVDRGDCMSS